tara:strand:+ start:816 stop:992 length:177 start_codon:yes stop_codon:yes gene_type:complete
MEMLKKEIQEALDLYVGDKKEEKKRTTPFGENPHDVWIHEKDLDKEKINEWFAKSVGH